MHLKVLKNFLLEIRLVNESLFMSHEKFQSDLEDKRVITEEEGQLLAVQHSIDFIEASALSGENVREAFLRMARRVKLKHEAKSAAATPKHNSVKIEQSSITGVSQGLNSKFSNCC